MHVPSQIDGDKLMPKYPYLKRIIIMLNNLGSTQRSLLRLMLKAKQGITIDAIVKGLSITKTAVYQHINTLEKNGYIKKYTQEKTQGRPSQNYVLSEEGIHLFPKQYAWFSELLIKKLKHRLGPDELENMMGDLGNQVAIDLQHRVKQEDPLETLKTISNIMNDIGYESSVSSEKDHIISACNCVYHDLAKEIPEVCAFDLALTSKLSGRNVEHLECMVRGGVCCRFRFGKPLDEAK